MELASNARERKKSPTPPAPSSVSAFTGFLAGQSANSTIPIAKPANANADHGNIGNSHGCGVPNVCTPLTYDSRYHGIHFARQVVQRGGVSIATPSAIAAASATFALRVRATQQIAPMATIDSPIMFSTSTRARSVHGAAGQPS